MLSLLITYFFPASIVLPFSVFTILFILPLICHLVVICLASVSPLSSLQLVVVVRSLGRIFDEPRLHIPQGSREFRSGVFCFVLQW